MAECPMRPAPKLTRPDYDMRIPLPAQKNDEILAENRAENPWVYLDLSVDEEPVGRLVIELFQNVVPVTANNFRRMCVDHLHHLANGNNESNGNNDNEEKRSKRSLIGCTFYRVINRFMLQGGRLKGNDIPNDDSSFFDDENFLLGHERPFLLSMANCGPNTNDSEFFITTVACPHLDGRHVVFGRVVHGQGIVTDLEAMPTNKEDCPMSNILIADCGQFPKGAASWHKRELGLGEKDDFTQDIFPFHPEDFWIDWYDPFSFEEILRAIDTIRASGNHYFGIKDNKRARRKYVKALKYVELLRQSTGNSHDERQEELIRESQIPCMLNLAATELRSENFDAVVKLASDVLTVDSSNVKALFRRSKAFTRKSEFELAMKDLQCLETIVQNEQEQRAIAGQKRRVRVLKEIRVAEEKKLYGRMMA